MWPLWSSQCWPPLWINPSRKVGPFVQSELFASSWTRPRIPKTSNNLFPSHSRRIFFLDQVVLMCHNLSDQEALQMHHVKAHDVTAFASSKTFQGGVSLDQVLLACRWRFHNTFTKFYLKDVARVDFELYRLGPIVEAQQI